jgi:hypothetical protein
LNALTRWGGPAKKQAAVEAVAVASAGSSGAICARGTNSRFLAGLVARKDGATRASVISNVIVITLVNEFIFKIFLDSSNWGGIASNIRF